MPEGFSQPFKPGREQQVAGLLPLVAAGEVKPAAAVAEQKVVNG